MGIKNIFNRGSLAKKKSIGTKHDIGVPLFTFHLVAFTNTKTFSNNQDEVINVNFLSASSEGFSQMLTDELVKSM